MDDFQEEEQGVLTWFKIRHKGFLAKMELSSSSDIELDYDEAYIIYTLTKDAWVGRISRLPSIDQLKILDDQKIDNLELSKNEKRWQGFEYVIAAAFLAFGIFFLINELS